MQEIIFFAKESVLFQGCLILIYENEPLRMYF